MPLPPAPLSACRPLLASLLITLGLAGPALAEDATDGAAAAAAAAPGEAAEAAAPEAAAPEAAAPPRFVIDPPAPPAGVDPLALSDVLASSVADSLLERPYRNGLYRDRLSVRSGQTLLGILDEAGVPGSEARAVVAALEPAFDPSRLQVGQPLLLDFTHAGRAVTFDGLEMMPDALSDLSVRRVAEGGFALAQTDIPLETRMMAARGEIRSSLYGAATAAGVPDSVLVQAINAFSYDIDFQRDIQPGDSFRLMFEQVYNERGQFVRGGDFIYAALRVHGQDHAIYRYTTEDGREDLYTRDGRSIRKALLRTPIDGARISSTFGRREHPILGYTRMHRGVDFAAPRGTPIYAAGDGEIEIRGPRSGFGNYIRIRHNSHMETAYGHMSRFADGFHVGSAVEQGDVIGYVGATGLATGPHLHYEVLIDGTQVNPLSVDIPVGGNLTGAELDRFEAMVAEIDQRFSELSPGDPQVAEMPAD